MSRSEHADSNNAEGSILVVCRGWQIEPDTTVLRTVGMGKKWAQKFNPPLIVSAVVLGEATNAGKMLGQFGADRVFCCPDADVTRPIQALAHTISCQAADQSAAWVFTAAEGPLKSLSPFVAGLLNGQLISFCQALEKDEAGNCCAWRTLHQGRLQQEIKISHSGIRVISWDVNALPPVTSKKEYSEAHTETVALSSLRYAEAISPEEIIKGDPRTLPLVEADAILAVGRGVGPEGMPLIEKVADHLEASLGATRPIVDQDMLPYERQIGQTGVSVSPRLLLTCGISGANEFTVGMDGARTVIAVNTDSQARIYQMADLGLVGDWQSVMEEMLLLLVRRSDGDKRDQRLEE